MIVYVAEMCLNSNYSRVLCAEIIEDIVEKSVVNALFTEIGHHEHRAYNEDTIYPTFQLS